MIYLIGKTGAAETNDEQYAQTLEKYSYYQRCTEDEYHAKLLEIEAHDNAEVDQPTELTYCPPDEVYLQVRDEDGDTPKEVTWSDDRVHDTDVEYVLASRFRQAEAERDTLQALVPLYRAVDRYLYHGHSNSYPKGYSNRNRLAALWETFRGMSIDAVEDDLKEESDEAVV